MLDFRLQVFYTVCETLSFNKAAEKLFISQPAVTKHIKELELHFKTTLFNRTNKKVSLTEEGKLVKLYAENVFKQYSQLEFDLNLIKNKTKGKLRLGASTTISQYILPEILAKFHARFPELKISLTNGNSSEIEMLFSQNKIDLGIVEGINKNTDLKYVAFLKDEIVLVGRVHNELLKTDTITVKQLLQLPLITREEGSGTLDIMNAYFKKQKISFKDLHIEMQLGSTEAIKNYLLHSNCLAFLSVFSVQQELINNQLKVIDVKGFDINRTLHYCYPQGQPTALVELFIKFASALR
ncbi:HTH-type transcriptional activator CmpR [mine drainage metagenome]|uniref:HTH-type transcriptional activator CmpR n=1 Tax=mine drainage metagenome TaxID=410659 RepID=A0A1J5S4E0_9ZZZZ